jgi:zinc transporter ZupT
MLSRAHARVHWHNNRYHHQPSLSSLLHRRCLLLRAAAAPAMHGRIAMSALPTPELPPIVAAPATSPLPGLLGTCLCMFVAAYVGGMLPGVLSHHHDREKSGGTSSRGGALLPVLGAGLLLGAALGVILPEGFEAAYGMADKHVPDWQVAAALLGGFWVMLALDWQAARTLPTGSSTGATAAGSAGDDARGADCGGGHGQHTSMLVTPSADDTLPRDAPGAGRAMSKHARSSSSSSSSSGWPPLSNPAMQALLGLLVHALSDGLAVGAASLAAAPGVTLSVALAMVMHKGPVAVGLGSFLRAARWQQAQVHKGELATWPSSVVDTFGSVLCMSLTCSVARSVLPGADV